VKIRAGWDATTVNCEQVARVAEDAGVDGITLHPRTRSQGYAGSADWNLVERLARQCRVPVIGNGDIGSAAEAVDRLRGTSCAAVMVGRAALSRPWLFRQAEDLWRGRPLTPDPAPEQIGEDLLLQLKDLVSWKGERTAVVEMRKFMAWAAKGLRGAADFRRQGQTLTGAAAVEEHVRRFFAGACLGAEGEKEFDE
jgi:tRNA-dihydrouridine synthase